MPDMNAPRPVVHGEIGDLEHRHLAHPKPGLDHQLDQGVVAAGEPMAGGADNPRRA